jgi:hypothetical protein
MNSFNTVCSFPTVTLDSIRQLARIESFHVESTLFPCRMLQNPKHASGKAQISLKLSSALKQQR